jgi:hypothetical protein
MSRVTISPVINKVVVGGGTKLIITSPGPQGPAGTGGGGGGSGTVTSVGMTVPSFLSVAGSPIINAGTFALSLVVEPAHTVFAGPTSGADAAPTYRLLVASDIPAIPESGVTNLTTDLAAKANLSGASFTGAITTSKRFVPGFIPLAYAANLDTDVSLSNVFSVGLAGDVTLNAPTNPVNGQEVEWLFFQDATGSRVLTLNAIFVIPAGLTLTLNPVPNSVTALKARYQSGTFKWLITGFTGAYTIPESYVVNLTSDLALKAPLASPTFTGTVTVPAPSNATDAASKSYVDAVATGLDLKASVRAASTATVTVTYTATGGTSARGQITAAPNTLDGVTLAANDRLLLKDQSAGAQNGIWAVTTLGTGANGVWDRAADFDQDAEVTTGAFTFVSEGTVNADSGFTLTTNDPITIGGASGTVLVWSQFSQAGTIIGGNLGAGSNVYASKTGATLNFRSILAGSGKITVTQNTNDITLDIGTGIPESSITSLVSDLAAKAPLASPSFTGTVGAVSITATKAIVAGTVVATYAASYTTDAALGNSFFMTLTGNLTLANPTGGADGQEITWILKQDGTGGRTLTLGASFRVPGAGSSTTFLKLSVSANAVDTLKIRYSNADGKWEVLSFDNENTLRCVEPRSIVFNGGGSLVTTANSAVYFAIPFDCDIVGWDLVADGAGNLTVEVEKCNYATFPTTASIAASAKPSLSAAQKNTDSTLTGWTTAVTAGDQFKVYLSGTPTIVTYATLTLKFRRR